MDRKTLKKEFKKRCREEKRKSYRYNAIGTAIAAVSLVLILAAVYIFESTDLGLRLYPLPIVVYAILAIPAIIGGVLDILGDRMQKREFEEYLKTKEQ